MLLVELSSLSLPVLRIDEFLDVFFLFLFFFGRELESNYLISSGSLSSFMDICRSYCDS